MSLNHKELEKENNNLIKDIKRKTINYEKDDQDSDDEGEDEDEEEYEDDDKLMMKKINLLDEKIKHDIESGNCFIFFI
jgi:hypothetical protein